MEHLNNRGDDNMFGELTCSPNMLFKIAEFLLEFHSKIGTTNNIFD